MFGFLQAEDRPARAAAWEPLFFHHIAKTAGTSLIKALRALTPRRLRCTEHGNLSAAYVAALVARGLRPGQFIYGHPGTAAALKLRGRARIVTLLRDPRDQVISNYFWIRKDYRVPDHTLSWRLGFRDFLLARPYFAIFQTASLHVGIERTPLRRTEDLIDRLPLIFAYLEEMHLVGTVGQVEGFFARLAADMGCATPPPLPHRRRTWLRATRRAALRAEFDALQQHPTLGPLLAAEQAVYAKALSLGRAQGLDPP